MIHRRSASLNRRAELRAAISRSVRPALLAMICWAFCVPAHAGKIVRTFSFSLPAVPRVKVTRLQFVGEMRPNGSSCIKSFLFTEQPYAGAAGCASGGISINVLRNVYHNYYGKLVFYQILRVTLQSGSFFNTVDVAESPTMLVDSYAPGSVHVEIEDDPPRLASDCSQPPAIGSSVFNGLPVLDQSPEIYVTSTAGARVDSIRVTPRGGLGGVYLKNVSTTLRPQEFLGKYPLPGTVNSLEMVVYDSCGKVTTIPFSLRVVRFASADPASDPSADSFPADPPVPPDSPPPPTPTPTPPTKSPDQGNFADNGQKPPDTGATHCPIPVPVPCPSIDTTTGSSKLRETDVSPKGKVAPAFSRTYQSLDALSGPLGKGWTHSYNMQAIRVRDPDSGKRTTIVRWGDGSRLRFEEQADGRMKGPPGWFLTAKREVTGRFVLSTPDKTMYSFDEKGFVEQIQYEYNNSVRLVYDGGHKLTDIVPSTGVPLTLSYDANSKLVSVESAGDKATFAMKDGRLEQVGTASGLFSPTLKSRYIYDSDRLTELRDAEHRTVFTAKYDEFGRTNELNVGGSLTSYTYDRNTRMAGVKFADQSTIAQVYTRSRALAGIKDQTGAVSFFSVNAQARVTGVLDPLRRETKYSYSPSGIVTSVVAADGTSSTVTLREIKGVERPTAVRLPSGATSTTDYDPATGLPLRRTDPSGVVTTYRHDQLGRLIESTTSTGLVRCITYAPHGDVASVTVAGAGSSRAATTLTEYDAALRPHKVTDPVGAVTTTHYDSKGRVEAVVDAANGVTTYVRDRAGNVIKVVDARGFASSSEYDPLGRVIAEVNALGQLTTRRYNARGRLEATINFRGEQTTQQYDLADRVVKVTDAASNTTTMAYDAAGQMISRGDARGFVTKYRFDSVGRLVGTTHPDLTRTATVFDADGHVRSTVDELERETRYDVDPAGRVIATHLPDGESKTETAYDADGRVVEQIDPLGRKTRTEYDEFGRPFKTTVAVGTSSVTTYVTEFDLAGRVSAIVTGRGARWVYTYDPLGRKTSETDPQPQGSTRTWKYDPVGNVIETREPDAAGPIVTSFRYDDPLGRVTRIERPDELVEVIYEDPADRSRPRTRTTAITRGAKTLTIKRGYDALGRLAFETVGANTVAYTYDGNSNVTALSLNGAPLRSYAYDSRNRCTRITDERATLKPTVRLSYDGAGQLMMLEYPSGIKKKTNYGKRGEVRRIEYTTAQDVAIRSLDFVYDKALRLLTKVDSGSGETTYSYDDLDRLTRVDYPDQTSEMFRYDQAGNIVMYAGPAGEELRGYDGADQLTHISGARVAWFTYNKRGQLTRQLERDGLSTRTRDLRFDSAGRLVSVADDGAQQLEAGYRDGYELDSVLTPEDGASVHLWALGNIFMDVTPDGGQRGAMLSLLGMDEPVERRREDGTYETLLTDHLQSAIAAYDEAGSVIRSTEFHAFGTIKSGAVPEVAGFHGARPLGKTGLYYLRNRVYDPTLGRFLTRDPAGFVGGTNHYSYADNAPQTSRDPSGLWVDATYSISEHRLTIDEEDGPGYFTTDGVHSGSRRNEHGVVDQSIPSNDPDQQYDVKAGPIPEGEYWIRSFGIHESDTPGFEGGDNKWYRLERVVGRTGNTVSLNYLSFPLPLRKGDRVPVMRGEFNLHVGRRSIGCVTVWSEIGPWDPNAREGYPTSTDMDKIHRILQNTSRRNVAGQPWRPPLRRGNAEYVGRLMVTR